MTTPARPSARRRTLLRELSPYLDGELSPARRRTVERHISSEEAEASPVKLRRLTRLFYRHWDEWRESTRHHVFVTGC